MAIANLADIMNTRYAAMNSLELLQDYVDNGNTDLFRELMGRHRELVFRTSMRVLRESADAEDATQETFIRLARHAGKVDTCVESWLAMCATNCSLEILRARKRRLAREQRWVEMEERRRQDQRFEQLRPLVDECLSKLARDERDLLVNYYLRGQTMRHIGRHLGVDAATVKRRLDRAKVVLRERMRGQGLLAARNVVVAWLVPLPLLFWYYRIRYRNMGWKQALRQLVFG
jgi:RNA polymerase sigma factor (sigma-70 family)